jgi:hypothetical protein
MSGYCSTLRLWLCHDVNLVLFAQLPQNYCVRNPHSDASWPTSGLRIGPGGIWARSLSDRFVLERAPTAPVRVPPMMVNSFEFNATGISHNSVAIYLMSRVS